MAIALGQVIDGKYRITGTLGDGGMGTVYEGLHELVHRKVAIKVLHAHVAKREEMVRRFEREAQAAGRIGSRHIVEVLDVGKLPSGERFMVMEHLAGESLGERLRRHERLSPGEMVPLAIQLLSGLSAAHAADIIHRDLKPANVFLTRTEAGADYVKIVDFGVSKFRALEAEGSTDTGALIGTPHYIAPEQLEDARAVDARSDIYSAGVILFRALSGRLPFDGETVHALFKQLISDETPSLGSFVDLDPDLVAIVDRAIAKDPEARYPDALSFREDLESWLKEHGGELPISLAESRPQLLSPPRGDLEPSHDTLLGASLVARPRRGRGLLVFAAAAAAVVAVALGLRATSSPETTPASSEKAPPKDAQPVGEPAAPPIEEPVSGATAEPAPEQTADRKPPEASAKPPAAKPIRPPTPPKPTSLKPTSPKPTSPKPTSPKPAPPEASAPKPAEPPVVDGRKVTTDI